MMVLLLAACAHRVAPPPPEAFVAIEPGTFQLDGVHPVTLTYPFWMQPTEVTRGQYDPEATEGRDLPVVSVTWFDAVAHANARSEAEGLTPAYRIDGREVVWDVSADGYRLPTEAEWLYVAQSGGAEPCRDGNVDECDDGFEGLAPVGQFPPTPQGVYDLYGNAAEMLWNPISAAPQPGTDPVGPTSGVQLYRQVRGWGVDTRVEHTALDWRVETFSPSQAFDFVGFRLVRGAVPLDRPIPVERSTTGPERVRLPGGPIRLGYDRDVSAPSDPGQADVVVSPFELMTHEVTQGLWREVMGTEPARGVAERWSSSEYLERLPELVGDDLPVIGITWNEAVAFANALSVRDGLEPVYTIRIEARPYWHGSDKPREWTYVTWDQQADGYRLPTEAEWEFAARGGRDGINQLPLGRVATVGQLCAHGNTEDVQYDTVWGGREGRCDDGYAGLAPVGSFPPNAYGVHDLMGNAPELVWDAWSFGQYDPGVDPGGQFGAASHVLKGGSFTQDLQVAFRLWQDADDRERIQGLRLARGTRPVRELGDVGSDDLLEVVRAEPGTLEENTVTRALAVMPGLVTRGLYREIMGSAPTTGPDDAPVTEVTVVDAARFAEALNARDGLQRTYWVEERNVAFHPGTTGWRLPTEAEWAWVTREGGPVPASGECEWVNDGSGPPATGVDPFGYQGGHLCRKTGAPRGSRYGDGAFRLVRTLP